MGLLERFLPSAGDSWHPPPPGMCGCENHVEDLLDEEVPLADGSGSVPVSTLVAGGGLICFAAAADRRYLEDAETGARRGPFHWRVICGSALQLHLSPDAPIGLDDAVFVQPGVDTVLSQSDEICIGAPRLCSRGVQGALIRALQNPRLRQST